MIHPLHSYRLEEPLELAQFQTAEWDPMLEWINKKYETDITSSTSIVGPQIPSSTKDIIRNHLSTRSDWALVGEYKTLVPYTHPDSLDWLHKSHALVPLWILLIGLPLRAL